MVRRAQFPVTDECLSNRRFSSGPDNTCIPLQRATHKPAHLRNEKFGASYWRDHGNLVLYPGEYSSSLERAGREIASTVHTIVRSRTVRILVGELPAKAS